MVVFMRRRMRRRACGGDVLPRADCFFLAEALHYPRMHTNGIDLAQKRGHPNRESPFRLSRRMLHDWPSSVQRGIPKGICDAADNFAEVRQRMVNSSCGHARSEDPLVLAAMLKVPRHVFVPLGIIDARL